MSIKVKVERNLFARLAQVLNTRKAVIVEESREDIAKEARRRVHVVSGVLQRSIVATPQGVEAGAPYAATEELGIPPNRAAHPYLAPAVEVVRPKMLARLAGEELFGVRDL